MSGGPTGILWSILLLAGAIYLVVLILQHLNRVREKQPDRRDSLAIIDQRFAKGEISADEYQRMKDILSS